MREEMLSLPQLPPGLRIRLPVLRFGPPGARPRAYVQASMHADEAPAMLVADHLRCLLSAAENEGRLRGEVILVPQANPLGGAQAMLGHHMGRHHLPTGRNFNRFWPDATSAVMARREQFGDNAEANTSEVRRIVRAWLTEQAVHAAGADAALKFALMQLAHDADIVLDLHTDDDAELHLYVDRDFWPDLEDLAALLGATVVMLCRDSGGNAFEETVAAPYVALRGAGIPVHQPITVTVELRGRSDASDALAARDAEALCDFLVCRGVIAGNVAPPPFSGLAAPFAATEPVRAPAGGVLVFRREKGEKVPAGAAIADILDPATGQRTPVITRAGGRLFARASHRWVLAGDVIAKVQGRTPLPDRRPGTMMTD
jgi:hypothetical protein